MYISYNRLCALRKHGKNMYLVYIYRIKVFGKRATQTREKLNLYVWVWSSDDPHQIGLSESAVQQFKIAQAATTVP